MKKIISIFMSLILCFSMMPNAVFAEETEDIETMEEETIVNEEVEVEDVQEMPTMDERSTASYGTEADSIWYDDHGILHWKPVENATKYIIEVYPHPLNHVVKSVTVESSSTSYDLIQLLDEGKMETNQYRIEVTAVGTNVDKILLIRYFSPYYKLEAPTNLRWEGTVAKWDPVPNATGYYVYYSDPKNGFSYGSRYVEDTFFDFASKKPQTGWYFEVSADAPGYRTSNITEGPIYVKKGTITVVDGFASTDNSGTEIIDEAYPGVTVYLIPGQGGLHDKFVGWKVLGDDSDVNLSITYPIYFTMPDHDVTLEAQFEKGYAVTFGANGGSGTMDRQVVLPNEKYTIPDCGFNAPTGKRFLRWDIRIGTTDSTAFPGDNGYFWDDVTLTAIWTALEGSWKQNSKGWWYQYSDGSYPKNTIVEINGKNYGFNDSGYMVTGWFKYNDKWHYFNSKGVEQFGWVKVNEKWYYLVRNDGMLSGGKYYIDGVTYLFADNGVLTTGWYYEKTTGDYEYFTSKGQYFGWLTLNGKTYYLNKNDGRMAASGVYNIDGINYLFADNGAMNTNKWLGLLQGWMYFGEDGKQVTGWKQIKGIWYYFNPKKVNAMAEDEFVTIGEKTYYFNAKGAMVTGWYQDTIGDWRYFESNGAMVIGWKKVGNYWYYFLSDGSMVSNDTLKIDGKYYDFDTKGHWVK